MFSYVVNMRLDLNKRTDLALRAMEELCVKESRVAGPDLAEALSTTRQYLPQILNPLVKARWVRSTPGPHGTRVFSLPHEGQLSGTGSSCPQ